jgi:alkylation response protein AidB-like acyl-CoA dehydrogenase
MIFTDEQRAFRKALRDFCARECGSREKREQLLDAGEEDQSTPLYEKLAALDYLGVAIPEEYGGSGGDYVDQVILFEELWAGLAPVKALGPTTTVAGCYKRFASESQKHDALKAVARGAVMAISISEPGAGSDVAAISCTAKPGDGGWIINGQKTWCSYAHMAERILLVARTSKEEKRHQGLSIFEVPGTGEGIETARIGTLGGREVNDVFFTDCYVTEESLVGELGQGFRQIMSGLNGERLLGAAVGLGIARRALEETLAYVKERQQFGRPIGSNQALRHRLADIAIELECAELLTYEVAARMSNGGGNDPELTKLTSMAKIKTSEVAKHAALEGVQMLGGYGYANEYELEGLVRHSLVLPIYAGTNEIQRDIVSGALGLRV